MKRLAIILTLLITGALSTFVGASGQEPAAPPSAAQPPTVQTPDAQTPDAQTPAVPDQARQRLEQIKERLKLTPEQVEQVRPIIADEMQKLKALRDSSSGGGSRRDRMKMARELKRIQGDADDQLKKVLSKEQMNELKKIREERRQQLRERAGNRAG
jgi:hypothetical protein